MQDLYPSRGTEEKIIQRVDKTVYSKKRLGEQSLNNIQIEHYNENGFVVIPNLFSADEIKTLLDDIQNMASNDELCNKEEFIYESNTKNLRTIFNQHIFSDAFKKISQDARILEKVQQILDGDVYIHHSRINIKPAYVGKSFQWHSDFETWHSEDGLPQCRCLSAWIMLTDNTHYNGPLYLLPGSHKKFVSCKGMTPEDNYKNSLKKQEYGVPSVEAIQELSTHDIEAALGKAGTLVIHDGNIMHGSPDNISPTSRKNAFFVYNSIYNKPTKPFAATKKRADFLSLDDYTPVRVQT
ncbi:MAG: phytanoyl-CoA dioxygenase family protein [Arcobacteraceae bacterium]